MKRIHLTSEPEKWFDMDKAEIIKEETEHNGQNWISLETGSQWEHVFLFITAGGKFIMNKFSDFQGSSETYELASKEEAAEFCLRNRHYDEAERIQKGITESNEIK